MENFNIELFQNELKKALKKDDRESLLKLLNSKNEKKISILYQYLHKELRKNNSNYIRNLLGLLALEKNDLKTARKYYVSTLKSDYNRHNFEYAMKNLAIVDFYEGKLEEAQNKIDMIIGSNDLIIQKNVYFLLGKMEYFKFNNEKSIEYLKKAYLYNSKITSKTNVGICKCLGFAYFKLEKWQEALNYFLKCFDNFNNQHYDYSIICALIYICKKLNIKLSNYNFNSRLNFYSISQLMNYSTNVMLEHVQKHFIASTDDYFAPYTNILEICEKVKNQLVHENELHPTYNITKTFNIYCPNIGVKGSNYLRVVTLPDINEIITLYPANAKNEELTVDSNIDFSFSDLDIMNYDLAIDDLDNNILIR